MDVGARPRSRPSFAHLRSGFGPRNASIPKPETSTDPTNNNNEDQKDRNYNKFSDPDSLEAWIGPVLSSDHDRMPELPAADTARSYPTPSRYIPGFRRPTLERLWDVQTVTLIVSC